MSTYDPETGPVDIIFAGGGTAACVAAGRLAKANPDLKILLVEGGRNNFQDPTVTNPAVYLSHLAQDSKTALVGSLFLSGRFLQGLFYFLSMGCIVLDCIALYLISSGKQILTERNSSTNPMPRHTSTTAKPSSPQAVFSAAAPRSIS